MANIDHPRGLQVYGELLRATEYKCVAAYAQDLFIGDPVLSIATGRDINIHGGATGPMLGAIIGIYDSDKVPLQYWDSGHSGEGYFLVADHPNQLFVAQGDGAVSYLDEDDCHGNVLMASGTGSDVNYLSGWELDDSDTADNTANNPIRLIRPVDRADNTVAIAHADWIVRINDHQNTAGVVGVGV